MDLEYVREFISLAELCDFMEASEQLFTSQASLSRHLKLLETELGVPLFTRTSRKVLLNQHGELFLPYAREMVAAYDRYQTAFQTAVSAEESSALKVGMAAAVDHNAVIDLLSGYQLAFPGQKIDIKGFPTDTLLRYTQERKCHVSFLLGDDLPEDAFAGSVRDPDPLPGIIVFHEPLLVILPEHLRALCAEDAVDPAALSGVPVYPLLEPELNRITQRVFQNMGFSLVFKEDAGYLDVNTIGELSRRSGCAICPAYCARHMLLRCTSSSLFAAPLRPSASVCIRMVFSEDQIMKEPLRSFLSYAVRHSEQPD